MKKPAGDDEKMESRPGILTVIANSYIIHAILIVLAAILIGVAYSGTAHPADRTSRDYDLSGFTAISVAGGWQLNITQDEEYRVKIIASPQILDQARVTVSGGRLLIDSDHSTGWTGQKAEIQVSLPRLESLEAAGSTQIMLSGLDSDRLSVELAGSGSIRSEDLKVNNFKIRTAGSAKADFRDAAITNAELDVAGSAEIHIRMAGGRLNGRVAGSADIVYYGELSEHDIRAGGSARFRPGE